MSKTFFSMHAEVKEKLVVIIFPFRRQIGSILNREDA
jgi:hypothetical protein